MSEKITIRTAWIKMDGEFLECVAAHLEDTVVFAHEEWEQHARECGGRIWGDPDYRELKITVPLADVEALFTVNTVDGETGDTR